MLRIGNLSLTRGSINTDRVAKNRMQNFTGIAKERAHNKSSGHEISERYTKVVKGVAQPREI